jgi:hypothetical protein
LDVPLFFTNETANIIKLDIVTGEVTHPFIKDACSSGRTFVAVPGH